MAKKKFNKEERLAIIKKLTKIASDRTEASWKKHREAYRPSAEYQRAKMLLDQRNSACEELTEIDSNIFNSWYDKFAIAEAQNYLNKIRDKEIKHLIERYEINVTDLEVEIILTDLESSVNDLIERLLRNCLCK
jgi:poly-D-alanine transfer protein DltD